MPRGKSIKPPSYRLHKKRNLAVVTIGGKDHYLGKYESPDSYQKYAHLIAEWRHGIAGQDQRASVSAKLASPLTVAELTLQYWERHAQAYYAQQGDSKGRLAVVQRALRALNGSYADLLASEFGPLALKTLREQLVEKDLTRGYINDLVSIIVAMFGWAVSEELVDFSIHAALKTVKPLRKGKSRAREGRKVRAVEQQVVEQTMKHVPPVVRDMIELQLLSGARPGEIRNLRPCDVERRDDGIWCYRPEHHKTEHHDKDRCILFGPKAQEVLQPYLDRTPEAYCFSPIESERVRHREMRKNRKVPVQPSQEQRRKRNPMRKPTMKYSKDAYNRAIRRACEDAGVARWTPHQLRHTAGTAVRRHTENIEKAQVVLGVSSIKVAEIYAERDFQTAAAIMREIG